MAPNVQIYPSYNTGGFISNYEVPICTTILILSKQVILSIDLYSKQCAIILIIIFICVLVSLSLLCVSILNDKKEMRIFHAAFTGRKMLVQEGKFQYRDRAGAGGAVRCSQVYRDEECLLPGHTEAYSLNITTQLKPASNNSQLCGYIEDQPAEWAGLDYSVEVSPVSLRHVRSSLPFKLGNPPSSLFEFLLQWCCGVYKIHLKTYKVFIINPALLLP